MAVKQSMKISIGPDGKVNIEVVGVGGPECLDFTQFLEEELGEVINRENTAEMYQHDEVDDTITVGGDDTGTDSSA